MNLLNALAKVGGMTFLSRLLGFVRDTLVARMFGAGIYTDAFFTAFKIPNLLRRIFAEGAFSQAFVPVLAEYKNRRGHEASKLLLDHIASVLFIVLLIVSVIGIFAAPAVVYVSAPGFAATPEKFDITVSMLRLTFPYILFISLVALAGGVLNTYNQFSVAAFTPTLLNVSFIVATLFFAKYFHPPVMVLAYAVLLGGVLQLAWQIPYLKKIDMLPTFRLDFKDEGVWRILKLMGPAVFGVSIAQLSLLINTIFASFLANGSVSWLYYADRLMEFPTGVLGAALGTILLPSLSKSFTDNSHDEYSQLLDWGLRLTLLLALPAAVALAVLAVPLICGLFYYGAFSVHDVWMTREALLAYSLGLLGLILVKVLAPGFYARQNIKTPVKIAIATLTATQLMNLAFIWKLQHAGLALSIGLGACMNATLLYYHLRKADIFKPQPGWGIFLLRVGGASIVMALVLNFAMVSNDLWFHLAAKTRLLYLLALVAVGAASYFAALLLFGIRVKHYVKRAV
ncbi:MAG TPA: murein biosynthesis integral membrane protein MurJ [Methylophilaceae bacterium]|jgi:putative peptidoglycan lipid II flippase